MQINQIIVRPSESVFIIQYSDSAGRSDNIVVDSTGNSNVSGLLANAQQRLPSEQNHPDKTEITQEIGELEYRLKMLKQSIGVPV
jgi:redox-regulated HSP33 family molecular chaperone